MNEQVKNTLFGYLLVILAVIVLLVAFCSSAWCQHPGDVRVKGYDSEASYHGSGTAIYCDDQGSWILTCAHNVRGIAKVEIQDTTGKTHWAKPIASDPDLDLALIWSGYKGEVRPLATDFNEDAKAWVTGWPGTGSKYRSIQTAVAGRTQRHVIWRGEVIQGQSGGSVVDAAGCVVGVIWGCDGRDAYTTCGDSLRQFVEKTVAKYKYKTQCQGGQCQIIPGWQDTRPLVAVPTPTPQPIQVPTPQPIQVPTPQPIQAPAPQPSQGCDCGDLADKIAANQAAIDELGQRFSDSLDKTQASLDQFEQTVDGMATLIEQQKQLTASYERLELAIQNTDRKLGELAASNPGADIETLIESLPPITIRYLRGDGTVHDSEHVRLGQTLDIQPIRIKRIVDGQEVAAGAVPVGGEFSIIDNTRK